MADECYAQVHYELGRFSGYVFGPSREDVLRYAERLISQERSLGWETEVVMPLGYDFAYIKGAVRGCSGEER